MTGDVAMNSTGFLKVPVGTDAQQPGQSGAPTAAIGQFRYNSDQNRFEGYKNTGWGELGGGAGATGGGTDQGVSRDRPKYYGKLIFNGW